MDARIIQQLRELGDEYPPPLPLPHAIVRLSHCSEYEHFCKALRAALEPSRYCWFCTAPLAPLYTTSKWLLLQHKESWLIVPKLHLRSLNQLGADDCRELQQVRAFAQRTHQTPTLRAMAGPQYDATCSVEHVHFKLLTPSEVTRARAQARDHRANYARLRSFVNRAIDTPGGFGAILTA